MELRVTLAARPRCSLEMEMKKTWEIWKGKEESKSFGEYRLFLGLGKHSILLKIVFSFKVF